MPRLLDLALPPPAKGCSFIVQMNSVQTPASQSAPVILVTGSSRGLGSGIALELARSGCSVAVHYSGNLDAAEQTCQACAEAAPAGASDRGQSFHPVQADLSNARERDELWPKTLDLFGHIDGLVNNAGISSPGRKDLLEAGEDGFDLVIAVNLKAPHFLAQAAARYWIEHPDKCRLPGGYKLTFVTSVSATMASSNRGDYCISKAGAAMSAQLWAARLAEANIDVIEFRPGIMATDMTSGVREKYDPLIQSGTVPARRWGKPADLGRAVRAFTLGDIPFANGAVLHIDGGLHLPRL